MDRQSIRSEGIIEMDTTGSGGGRSRHHNIPEEIIEEHIIVNLPVKSLFQFETVSKSWFNLIKSNDFKYKHFNRRMRSLREEEEEEEGGIYLAMCWLNYDEFPCIRPFLDVYLYELCDEIFAAGPSHTSQNNKKSFQIPGRPPCIDLYSKSPNLRNLRLANVCDGILCFDDNGIIMLVNPFLSELKRLPGEFLSRDKCGTCLLGFGFDKIIMDFKVVRIFPWEKEAEVYSLRSNAWRKLDETSGIPFLKSSIHTPCTFFDGNLYWFVSLGTGIERAKPGIGTTKPFPWRIISFNLATELFQLMELPPHPYPYDEGGLYAGLIVSNQVSSSLAFVFCSKDGLVNLWTLSKVNDNEEEVVTNTTSWTKLYSIQCSPHFSQPVCFSISKKHNTFIYLTRQTETGYFHLIKYDVMNQSSSPISEPIRIGQMGYYHSNLSYACYSSFQVGVCRPSLFSLNVM